MNVKSGMRVPKIGATKLLSDYLSGDATLESFITAFPSPENIVEQAREKSADNVDRKALVRSIRTQYDRSGILVPQFLDELLNDHSFTITTGHQLNLFGGTKYYIYKIVSVLKLCKELNELESGFKFLPVFWMATEDHDFAEINVTTVNGRRFSAEYNFNGPVGRLDPQVFRTCLEDLRATIGSTTEGDLLCEIFQRAFETQSTWADFTRYWVNEFFDGQVIIVDGDDAELKRKMTSVFEKELTEQITERNVESVNQQLEALGYHQQVVHRPINLFEIDDISRERIYKSQSEFGVVNKQGTRTLNELMDHPEKISPNALLRPVFQEVVLPNVAYIGGGAEVAYWMQLKQLFDELNIPFPIILLRDVVLFAEQKDLDELEKLSIRIEELAHDKDALTKIYLERNQSIQLAFNSESGELVNIFKTIQHKSSELHRDYSQMIEAEKARLMKFFKKLDLRVMRDAKFREQVNLNKLFKIREKYFPNGVLIERKTSFIEELILLGKENYLSALMEYSDPLDGSIKVMVVSN